ncbi:putative quorum-sensing-regulated virulence factor [Chromobacterium violaceum]|uniref:putative quorum-sensing-regulated virulence factor n=1 Tax=Chromobacterium violaceum TaxID=536 RepID=UPI00194EFA3C|nr:DUF3820 family protein [Chromobacterium violaceum]QRO34010.1 DUF3820 family protein [Chromobacterium violaceum]QRQ16187.1 DUF3820 family protein [Chromobacterium violaceum]
MTAIIFDCEHTGLNGPELIEAAWVRMCGFSLTMGEQFCRRYRPSKPIQLGAMAVHHIHEDDLVDCAPHTDFQLPAGTVYMIGHFIESDWKVIGQPAVKLIDTCALAKKVWPGLDSYSQSALLYHLMGREAREHLREAHNALADVLICHRILRAILLRLHEQGFVVDSWQRLHELSEEALVPTVMPFGKHKDTPLVALPRDYVSWAIKNLDHSQNPRLEKALRSLQ